MECLLLLILINSDFPVCTIEFNQNYPRVYLANNQYYIFWQDERFYLPDSKYAIFGARVSIDGDVIDPDGKLIFCDSVINHIGAAYDGLNFLIVSRNHC